MDRLHVGHERFYMVAQDIILSIDETDIATVYIARQIPNDQFLLFALMQDASLRENADSHVMLYRFFNGFDRSQLHPDFQTEVVLLCLHLRQFPRSGTMLVNEKEAFCKMGTRL